MIHKDFKIWLSLFLSFFLVLFLGESLEESMFIDGVWYATISRNLSEGIGSFWAPQFSPTIFSAFHEHPPLWFGFQSLFFTYLGDSPFTERIFTLFQYGLTFIAIISLWHLIVREKNPTYKYYWLIPVLLWQGNMLSYFFQSANLLDAGIALLDLLAIICLWSGLKNSNFVFPKIILAGFLLFLAFLTKGLVALFPLAFPTLYFIVFRNTSIIRSFQYTFTLFGSFLFCTLFLFYASPEALSSFQKYFDIQVLASLNGERRLYYFRESRFYILGQLFITLFPMLMALMILVLLRLKLKLKNSVPLELKAIILLLLIGLSASLPLMISPRQALPYLIPAIPYFSIAIALCMVPFLDRFMEYIRFEWPKLLSFSEQALFILLILAGSWVSLKNGEPNARDKAVIEDAKQIGKWIGPAQIISSQTYDMYISGYLMRFDQISLDTLNLQRPYLLTKRTQVLQDSSYKEVLIPLKTHKLYKKHEVLSNKNE